MTAHPSEYLEMRQYSEALAAKTEKLYGRDHVVPLTGGGDDPWMYEVEPGRWWIRGSYTPQKLPS